MSDYDFLIPRRLYSSTPEEESNLGPEAVEGVHIDQRVLEERRRRKKALAQHPKSAYRDEAPWSHLDRRFGEAFPVFDEDMWTPGDTARWVAERTREAVNGRSIDQERLFDIVLEIQKALAVGDVRAFAHTPNDPIPRELPSTTWAVYQLAIEERDSLLLIIPLRASGSPSYELVLLDLLLIREDVLQRWPGAKSRRAAAQTRHHRERECLPHVAGRTHESQS